MEWCFWVKADGKYSQCIQCCRSPRGHQQMHIGALRGHRGKLAGEGSNGSDGQEWEKYYKSKTPRVNLLMTWIWNLKSIFRRHLSWGWTHLHPEDVQQNFCWPRQISSQVYSCYWKSWPDQVLCGKKKTKIKVSALLTWLSPFHFPNKRIMYQSTITCVWQLQYAPLSDASLLRKSWMIKNVTSLLQVAPNLFPRNFTPICCSKTSPNDADKPAATEGWTLLHAPERQAKCASSFELTNVLFLFLFVEDEVLDDEISRISFPQL